MSITTQPIICAQKVFMVKPAHFGFNKQTAETNAFQKQLSNNNNVHDQAINEFMQVVNQLESKGVEVVVFESDDIDAPDSIFPNNWFSTHQNGSLILYPMFAENRRRERNPNAITMIKNNVNISNILDISEKEKQHFYLEGTGSIVFDHGAQIAYAAISPRTNEMLLNQICDSISYKPHPYSCKDTNGMDFYHTNVILHIGNGYAVLYEQGIENHVEKTKLVDSLKESGKEVIFITPDQVSSFCGNMLQVKNAKDDLFLLCSETALQAFDPTQKKILEKYSEITSFHIPTIEHIGGGGVRCMIAELY
jgi:hypothetical protein